MVAFANVSGNALRKADRAIAIAIDAGMIAEGDEVALTVRHDNWCNHAQDSRRDCNCDPDVFVTSVLRPRCSEMLH